MVLSVFINLSVNASEKDTPATSPGKGGIVYFFSSGSLSLLLLSALAAVASALFWKRTFQRIQVY